MKTLILLFALSLNIQASEVENQVITDSQFKKMQKQIEARETKAPYLPFENEIMNNKKKYVNKSFKVLILGDTIMGFSGNSKFCNFTYVKVVEDTGLEDKTGYGTYFVESSKGIGCKRLARMKGQDISSITLLVKFSSLARAPHKPSKIIPVLDVIKVE